MMLAGRIGVAHPGQVRSNIQRIGCEQTERGNYDNGFGEFLPETANQTLARHHPDASAHHLHHAHQRPRN
jgi:hypothetical protein